MQKTTALMLFALFVAREPGSPKHSAAPHPSPQANTARAVMLGEVGIDALAKFRTPRLAGVATRNLFAVTEILNPSVTIDGVGPGAPIMAGEWTWTAGVSGGTPPYTYAWERRSFCDNDFQLVGTQSSYVEDTEDGEDPFFLRLTVTDANLLSGSALRHFGGFIVCP